MVSPIIAYILGGLTLPPITVLTLIFYFYYTFPKRTETPLPPPDLSPFLDPELAKEYRDIRVTEIEEKEKSGVSVFRSGWLTVTTEYYEFPQNSANEKNNEPENSKSAYTALYKLVRKKSTNFPEKEEEVEPERTQKRRKNKYFAVLRHGNLFLYKDEDQTDVLHVIVLANHVIALWPRDLPDGQLFSKMSAICVLKKDICVLRKDKNDSLARVPPRNGLSLNEEPGYITTMDILNGEALPPKQTAFYIYPDRNYDKEDWYFDLVRATQRGTVIPTGTQKDLLEPSLYAKTFHPKTADVISLIQNLHASESQLQTRWFNALLGRIFLGLYGTELFENFITNKLLAKLLKINKPGFLDEFRIEKVNIGQSAPLLGLPQLKSLTPEGDLEVGALITYTGGISFEVSTKVNINLGTRFKPRDISILLAVTLRLLRGNVILQIKRPPTERIWWAFTSMPVMNLTVEPVVSARQITTGVITRTIENKLKDLIRESLVYPAMDDITFFSTAGEIYRGGVWDKSSRVKPKAAPEDEEAIEIEDEKSETSAVSSLTAQLSQASEHVKRESRPLSLSVTSSLNKSSLTVKVSGELILADGLFVVGEDVQNEHELEHDDDADSKFGSFKKIGKWYFKEGEEDDHKPVEMISRRRTKDKNQAEEEKHISSSAESQLPPPLPARNKEASPPLPPLPAQPYMKAPEMTFPGAPPIPKKDTP